MKNIRAMGVNMKIDSILTVLAGIWADTIITNWKPSGLIKYSIKSKKQGHLLDLMKADSTKKIISSNEIQRRIEGNVAINERQQIWLTQNRIIILLLIIWNIILTIIIRRK